MPKDPCYDIKTLLRQVGKGNELAFKAVIDFYKQRFYAAALKMTHCGGTAQEVVQEVFVCCWIKRAQVAAAANPEGYLFTILQNSIYAHFRKIALEKAMKRRIVQQIEFVDSSSVEDRLFAKEERELLEAAINQLPPQQRIIYRLSKQQGLSRQQIASELHLSPHTVKNHLQQAVRFICVYYKEGVSAFIFVVLLLTFKI